MRHNLTPSSPHLARWLLFLVAQTKPGLEELVKVDHIMTKALNVLEFLSHDEHTRLLYETRYGACRRKVRKKGKAGREEGMRDVARQMLRKGMSISEIAEVTIYNFPNLQCRRCNRVHL